MSENAIVKKFQINWRDGIMEKYYVVLKGV